MVRVLLSKDASSFARREASYLRRHSPKAAARFTQRLIEARRILASFPNIGPDQETPTYPGLRRLIVGDYILDYLLGDPIRVVGLRHGRQQPPDWEGARSISEDDSPIG